MQDNFVVGNDGAYLTHMEVARAILDSPGYTPGTTIYFFGCNTGTGEYIPIGNSPPPPIDYTRDYASLAQNVAQDLYSINGVPVTTYGIIGLMGTYDDWPGFYHVDNGPYAYSLNQGDLYFVPFSMSSSGISFGPSNAYDTQWPVFEYDLSKWGL
jgi:hypothetical protein